MKKLYKSATENSAKFLLKDKEIGNEERDFAEIYEEAEKNPPLFRTIEQSLPYGNNVKQVIAMALDEVNQNSLAANKQPGSVDQDWTTDKLMEYIDNPNITMDFTHATQEQKDSLTSFAGMIVDKSEDIVFNQLENVGGINIEKSKTFKALKLQNSEKMIYAVNVEHFEAPLLRKSGIIYLSRKLKTEGTLILPDGMIDGYNISWKG